MSCWAFSPAFLLALCSAPRIAVHCFLLFTQRERRAKLNNCLTLTFTPSVERSIEAKECACSGEIGHNNVLQ